MNNPTTQINFPSVDKYLNLETLMFVRGALLGIPFYFPNPSMKWFTFLSFLLGFTFFRIEKNRYNILYVACVICCIIFSFFSSFFSPYIDGIEPIPFIMTSLFFSAFLYGYTVTHPKEFLKGFSIAGTLVCTYVIAMYFITKQYENGVFLFVYPDLRNWGFDVIHEWPNFLCFGFCICFLINALLLNKNIFAIINILGALATTSRLTLVALGIYLLVICLRNPKYTLIILGGLSFLLFLFWKDVSNYIEATANLNSLLKRITKTNDREVIYNFLYSLFNENMWFGVGSLKVTYFKYFDLVHSYHNSYLETLCRFGILTFVPWLFLIFPKFNPLNLKMPIFFLLIFFIISSIPQNILKNPTYTMLFSFLLLNGKKIVISLVSHSSNKKINVD